MEKVSLFIYDTFSISVIQDHIILAENLFISNCFIHFTYHRNAVKSTFSLQMPLVNYSHSIVAGGLDVIS